MHNIINIITITINTVVSAKERDELSLSEGPLICIVQNPKHFLEEHSLLFLHVSPYALPQYIRTSSKNR